MVEVPVNDARHWNFGKCRRFDAVALRRQPVSARRSDDIARLAAVARYAACDTKLLQRNPRPVIGENHAKRCRTAFDGFHLQDDGCPSDASARPPARHAVDVRFGPPALAG
jgi:hypothetical protein